MTLQKSAERIVGPFDPEREPRLSVAQASGREAAGDLSSRRERNLGKLIEVKLTPLVRGWMNYFRLTKVKEIFEELDSWIRRKLRGLIWRQWKLPPTHLKGLI